ncbi:hypothetical protein AB1Y20_011349 [Prymnesium parvum]|uniref:Uncharacterized protein n=1 Tax=Prymnesium parvum TaxID=97485 RepID=A0AB34IPB3_PRYPA
MPRALPLHMANALSSPPLPFIYRHYSSTVVVAAMSPCFHPLPPPPSLLPALLFDPLHSFTAAIPHPLPPPFPILVLCIPLLHSYHPYRSSPVSPCAAKQPPVHRSLLHTLLFSSSLRERPPLHRLFNHLPPSQSTPLTIASPAIWHIYTASPELLSSLRLSISPPPHDSSHLRPSRGQHKCCGG